MTTGGQWLRVALSWRPGALIRYVEPEPGVQHCQKPNLSKTSGSWRHLGIETKGLACSVILGIQGMSLHNEWPKTTITRPRKFYCLRQCTSKRGCQSVRQASSQQTETHTLGFLSVADTGPSSGEIAAPE